MSSYRPGSRKLLCVGPVPPAIASHENPIGGGAVLFAEMIAQLRRRELDIDIMNTSRARTHLSRWKVMRQDVLTLLKLAVAVLTGSGGYRLVLFTTSAGRAWIGASCMWTICRVRRRPLALRFIGGDLAKRYDSYACFKRWWVDLTYMRSELVFVETRAIYDRFRKRGNFRWFPNTRDVQPHDRVPPLRMTKLLFFSRLNKEKGVVEAIEACRDLPEDCHLSVFGPPMPDTDLSLLNGHNRAQYGGVLSPTEVPRVLSEHHALVYPSYWESEGHPGVVLEALQCGLPVVTTQWRSIPEIVEHEISGLLVEPRSVHAVKAGIERLIDDPALYRKLCEGAKARGEFFRSGVWYDRMATDLRRIARV